MENNLKYLNKIMKQLKAYAKARNFNSYYNPYKAAYGSMPSRASANTKIKQLYLDGHFCIVYKFGLSTNGLSIVRHLGFYNKDFLDTHTFICPKTFLNDAAFDVIKLYKNLLSGDTFVTDRHFLETFIPLNARLHLEINDYTISGNSIPCYPHNSILLMKHEASSSHLRSGISTFKFVCPKMTYGKGTEEKIIVAVTAKTPVRPPGVSE